MAYTGPDGLEVARQWRPDVVLLDIGLPGLDGYEVARRLRQDPTHLQSMRLIAMTGYGAGHRPSTGPRGGLRRPPDSSRSIWPERVEKVLA